jgi:hypothetical protein
VPSFCLRASCVCLYVRVGGHICRRVTQQHEQWHYNAHPVPPTPSDHLNPTTPTTPHQQSAAPPRHWPHSRRPSQSS